MKSQFPLLRSLTLECIELLNTEPNALLHVLRRVHTCYALLETNFLIVSVGFSIGNRQELIPQGLPRGPRDSLGVIRLAELEFDH